MSAIDPRTRLLLEAPIGRTLLRLALHPRDAHHPAILRHMQALLEQLLRTRAPMTKAAFAAQLASQSVGAMCTPTASDATSPV